MLITMHLLEKARATGNRYRALLLIVVLQCWSASALASPNKDVWIDENTDCLDFHGSVVFLIDSLGAFSRESVGDGQLLDSLEDNYRPGKYNGGNLWAGFRLVNGSSGAQVYILEVGGYNEVHVFYRRPGQGPFREKVTGSYVPYPRNEMGKQGFLINKVRLELAAQATYECFVLYPDPGVDKIQPKFVITGEGIWDSTWRSIHEKRLITFMPFLGICLILALINFAYYFVHRERAYIHYTFYIVTSVLFAAALTGVLDFEPLVRFPILLQSLWSSSIVLLTTAYFFLFKSFLDLKKRFPFWYKTFNVLTVYLLVGLAVALWMFAVPRIPITAIATTGFILFAIMLVSMVFIYNIFRKREMIDTIFLSGSLVLVVQGIANNVLDLVVADRFIQPILFQVAIVIELTIFSLGLGVKLRLNIKEKQAARLRLIDQLKENEGLQRSISHKLEAQVQERTAEIQTQNEELITKQEELEAQRDMLEDQNKVIADSMEELEQIRAELEKTVERRTLELKNANLELLQRNDQLEQFAYITAHNLRGPVARLKGLIFLFDKLEGTNEENRDVFGKIARSAHEMDDVLTDMNAILEVKTNAQGRTAFVKIGAALEKAREALQDKIIDARPQIKVELRVEEVYGNPAYMEGIFENLLDNSMKYRSAKRELQIGIISRKDKGQVVIEVKDNGIGIDMKRSAGKIFRLYQRFHEHGEGKGLGLYLVKTQVEAMGGSISIESEVDVGTTLSISLPG
jgi:signal transduction histidine kinase